MSASNIVDSAVADALEGLSGSRQMYVGYSGGVDSSVLLHAAVRQRPEAIVALHVNHGLQSESDEWAAHCESECVKWGVELRSHHATVSRRGNVEAAARAARYDFFASQVPVGASLMLAHHRDDQAETLLLRLLQGRGYYGIPARRWLRSGSGTRVQLLRPLLALSRQVLLTYASHHGLSWVEDPSNAELDRDRNFLRHGILPRLRVHWPDLDATLVAVLRDREQQDAALLDALSADGNRLALSCIPKQSGAAAGVLRIWLASRGRPLPTKAALVQFVAQLAVPADRQPALVLGGGAGALRRYGDYVYIVASMPEHDARYALTLPGSLRLPHGELTTTLTQGPGFASRPGLAVVFVGDRPGARIRLRGHRRRVRELLHEAGVAPWRRPSYPLLVDTEGVAAVPGLGYRDPSAEDEASCRYVCKWSEFEELD